MAMMQPIPQFGKSPSTNSTSKHAPRPSAALPFHFDPIPDLIRQDIAGGKLAPLDGLVIGRCLRMRTTAGCAPGHACTKEAIAMELGKSPRTIQRSDRRSPHSGGC
jgi:hypothetical protein